MKNDFELKWYIEKLCFKAYINYNKLRFDDFLPILKLGK